jgi:hypothetical protein
MELGDSPQLGPAIGGNILRERAAREQACREDCEECDLGENPATGSGVYCAAFATMSVWGKLIIPEGNCMLIFDVSLRGFSIFRIAAFTNSFGSTTLRRREQKLEPSTSGRVAIEHPETLYLTVKVPWVTPKSPSTA